MWCRRDKIHKKIVSFKSPHIYKLLQVFAHDSNFIRSPDLLAESGYSSSSALYNGIRKLRKLLIEVGFDLGDPLISKQGFGFRPHDQLFLTEK